MSISQMKKSAWLEDQEFVISYDEVVSPQRRADDDEQDDDDDAEDEENDGAENGHHRGRRHHHRHRRNRHHKEQDAARDEEVRRTMNEYGISDNLIEKYKDSMGSNITGIYRLLMHRLEKQAFREEMDIDDGYNS
jgi:hypothetical protein